MFNGDPTVAVDVSVRVHIKGESGARLNFMSVVNVHFTFTQQLYLWRPYLNAVDTILTKISTP